MAQAISKMETTQTATQWLIEEIHKNMGVWIPPHIQDQAKAMEKEQIVNGFDAGYGDYASLWHETGEQYFNETYSNFTQLDLL